MNIIKIGGSKITTSENLKQIFDFLKNIKNNHFIVISAFGKTTSNLLKSIEIAKKSHSKNALDHKQILNQIFNFHFNLISRNLFLKLNDDDFISLKFLINNIIAEIDLLLNAVATLGNYSNKTKDKIISYGEILAFEILKFLNSKLLINKYAFISALDFVTTDDNYNNAELNYEMTKNKLLEIIEKNPISNNLYITQGFIGGTINNIPTTMGLESSNLTAVVIAKIFKSNSITLISDTYGILDSDPRVFNQFDTLPFINYSDAKQLSKLGLKLIYIKMIEFAEENNITLYYKSLFEINSNKFSTINNNFENLSKPVFLIDFHSSKILPNNLENIQLIKISIYNFYSFNFNKFYNDYTSIIDKITIEPNLNTIFISLNKNIIFQQLATQISKNEDANSIYSEYEKNFFNNFKSYFS